MLRFGQILAFTGPVLYAVVMFCVEALSSSTTPGSSNDFIHGLEEHGPHVLMLTGQTL